ncbi:MULTISPECIES: Crp/Fnr family transcriptional regulator [unclassified Microbulbifer]|uniref:Crp/Fnr family transcriptional regulator n=1 Tax=unclassified Microbulbifer TaxID=2619833 RepID=UPI0027E54491|nr:MULTISPECIES: Crp/Fnr family transcriptional regulator [unclassified Microbulbifer]
MATPPPPSADLHILFSRFYAISGAAWRAAKPCFSWRRFEKGAHFIEAGAPVAELFFLTDGLARFYYLDVQGREFNKSFAETGAVLSSVSALVSGSPSSFFVQALQSSQCLSVAYRDFLALTEEFDAWRQLQLRLLEQLVIRKERREADFLRLSATERYQQFLREYARVAHAIPNYHIASYLGITEVALSRIRRRLKLTRVNDPASG